MNIRLDIMTRELCRAYMQEFNHDAALFLDPSQMKPYIYHEQQCDAYFERNQKSGRVHLAILHGEEPIGEVILKNIDCEQKQCSLGICLKNDRWKNKGFGTEAERLVLQYAFEHIGMDAVAADALQHNKRSQHVLKKVGFQETHQDAHFVYYVCKKG